MQAFGEAEILPLRRPDGGSAGTSAHRVFECFDQARLVLRPRDGTIGDDVEVRAPAVGDLAWRHAVEVADLAPDPNASVSVAHQGFADADEVLGIGDGNRIGHQDLLACKLGHDALGSARRSIPVHQLTAARAVKLGRMRPEMLRVVGDFGHRAHRRAAGPNGRLAIDGDSDRDRIELVDRRPRESFQKLPRVGAEAFDVATLSLGVERLERQR